MCWSMGQFWSLGHDAFTGMHAPFGQLVHHWHRCTGKAEVEGGSLHTSPIARACSLGAVASESHAVDTDFHCRDLPSRITVTQILCSLLITSGQTTFGFCILLHQPAFDLYICTHTHTHTPTHTQKNNNQSVDHSDLFANESQLAHQHPESTS